MFQDAGQGDSSADDNMSVDFDREAHVSLVFLVPNFKCCLFNNDRAVPKLYAEHLTWSPIDQDWEAMF